MKKFNNASIIRFLSILLGVIYIISGASKGMSIDSFVNLLINYGNSWLGYLAPLITGFEIFLGFGLVFGGYPRQLAKISFGFIILLSLSFLWAYFFRGVQDCGCFGELLKLSPLFTLLKNVALLFISLVVWQKSSNFIYKKWALLIPILFGLVTIFVNGVEVKERLNSDVKLYALNLENSFINSYLKSGNQGFFMKLLATHGSEMQIESFF